MSALARVLLAGCLALWGAPRAWAAVDISMIVDGPRGPFSSGDAATPRAVKLSSVHLDLGASAPGPLVAPRPVVVTRPVDVVSWQFLEAAGSRDVLRVVITVARRPSDTGPGHRRVVTLTNARVVSVRAGMEANGDDARPGVGRETIAFSYERIEVEDDGVRVFSSGE